MHFFVSVMGFREARMKVVRVCLCWDLHANAVRDRRAGLTCCLQFHSCAVLRGGTVSCWGSNAYGQANHVLLLYLFFL